MKQQFHKIFVITTTQKIVVVKTDCPFKARELAENGKGKMIKSDTSMISCHMGIENSKNKL